MVESHDSILVGLVKAHFEKNEELFYWYLGLLTGEALKEEKQELVARLRAVYNEEMARVARQ
jgi:hypothetical protein